MLPRSEATLTHHGTLIRNFLLLQLATTRCWIGLHATWSKFRLQNFCCFISIFPDLCRRFSTPLSVLVPLAVIDVGKRVIPFLTANKMSQFVVSCEWCFCWFLLTLALPYPQYLKFEGLLVVLLIESANDYLLKSHTPLSRSNTYWSITSRLQNFII